MEDLKLPSYPAIKASVTNT